MAEARVSTSRGSPEDNRPITTKTVDETRPRFDQFAGLIVAKRDQPRRGNAPLFARVMRVALPQINAAIISVIECEALLHEGFRVPFDPQASQLMLSLRGWRRYVEATLRVEARPSMPGPGAVEHCFGPLNALAEAVEPKHVEPRQDRSYNPTAARQPLFTAAEINA